MIPQQKAVFLDRDGVLIKDVGLLTLRDQVCVYRGVPQALRALSASEYLLFVVTNQTVVARGLATEKSVKDINAFIAKVLFEKSGCRIERFYYCPHHPEATLREYRIKCGCRKPRPGMFLKAADEYNLDLRKCFMVGDRISDIIAGQTAGCTNILVETGMHREKPIVSDAVDLSVKPDYICDDLDAASEIILKKK